MDSFTDWFSLSICLQVCVYLHAFFCYHIIKSCMYIWYTVPITIYLHFFSFSFDGVYLQPSSLQHIPPAACSGFLCKHTSKLSACMSAVARRLLSVPACCCTYCCTRRRRRHYQCFCRCCSFCSSFLHYYTSPILPFKLRSSRRRRGNAGQEAKLIFLSLINMSKQSLDFITYSVNVMLNESLLS